MAFSVSCLVYVYVLGRKPIQQLLYLHPKPIYTYVQLMQCLILRDLYGLSSPP